MKNVFIAQYTAGRGVGHAWPAAAGELEALADETHRARLHRVDVMRDMTAGRFSLATHIPGERIETAAVGSGRVTGPGRIVDGEGQPSALAGCDNAAGCPLAAVCMRADPRHKTRFDTGRGALHACRYMMLADPAYYRPAVESTDSNETNGEG